MEHDGQNFVSFWTIFWTPHLTTQKIKILKKWTKCLEISSFCMFAPYIMYGSWDMERDGQNFLSFWTIFSTLTTRKIKILKKWKMPGDIIVLHTCTKNHNHMIIGYTVPEIRHWTDLIYFSFWAICYSFKPLTIQKFKI